jgi:hypothetical protein
MALLRLFRSLLKLVLLVADILLLVCLPLALAFFTIYAIEEKVEPRQWGRLFASDGVFFPYAAVLILLLSVTLLLTSFLTAWDWTGVWFKQMQAKRADAAAVKAKASAESGKATAEA